MSLSRRAEMTLHEVGQRGGLTSAAHIHYATRPHREKSKRGLLTVRQIRQLAKVVKATPEEEVRLIILGSLEHTPPVMQDYVLELEADLEEYRKELGRPKRRYRILDL